MRRIPTYVEIKQHNLSSQSKTSKGSRKRLRNDGNESPSAVKHVRGRAYEAAPPGECAVTSAHNEERRSQAASLSPQGLKEKM